MKYDCGTLCIFICFYSLDKTLGNTLKFYITSNLFKKVYQFSIMYILVMASGSIALDCIVFFQVYVLCSLGLEFFTMLLLALSPLASTIYSFSALQITIFHGHSKEGVTSDCFI